MLEGNEVQPPSQLRGLEISLVMANACDLGADMGSIRNIVMLK